MCIQGHFNIVDNHLSPIELTEHVCSSPGGHKSWMPRHHGD